MRILVAAMALMLIGCGDDELVKGHNDLKRHVETHKVGHSADQWIEMVNGAGEWERVGLIFGYVDDYGECLKSIAGLKRANSLREYRCVPAN